MKKYPTAKVAGAIRLPVTLVILPAAAGAYKFAIGAETTED